MTLRVGVTLAVSEAVMEMEAVLVVDMLELKLALAVAVAVVEMKTEALGEVEWRESWRQTQTQRKLWRWTGTSWL